jgi:hypothetical protein
VVRFRSSSRYVPATILRRDFSLTLTTLALYQRSLRCPFGKAAQIRKISVNAHKKEDNRPIQQNVLRFVSDKNESGTII